MIGLIATLTALPGFGGELAQLMSEIAPRVLSSETGTKLYQVMRLRGEPDIVVVLELYESLQAYEEHEQSPLLNDLRPRVSRLLAGTPTLTFLDEATWPPQQVDGPE